MESWAAIPPADPADTAGAQNRVHPHASWSSPAAHAPYRAANRAAASPFLLRSCTCASARESAPSQPSRGNGPSNPWCKKQKEGRVNG